jgi:hypothetical protein
LKRRRTWPRRCSIPTRQSDPRGDVDAIAIVVVGFDDNVAPIDADAVVHDDTRVPHGHRLLHGDCTAHPSTTLANSAIAGVWIKGRQRA